MTKFKQIKWFVTLKVSNMHPFVSIIIPALNEERYIGRCLEALTKLEYPRNKIEIILVDNYSTDQTVEIAKKFPVDIIQIPPKTIANSRNTGAQNSSGEIFAFLDSDCIAASFWLKNAIIHFTDQNVVAVGAYPDVLEEESSWVQSTWSRLCNKDTGKITKVDWLPSANTIVRADIFHKINGFNEFLTTCEDTDLGYRMKKEGVIIHDSNVKVYHLREPRTLYEFYKKERWHSRANIAGAISHGLKISEFPSLFFPAFFGLCFFVFVGSLMMGSEYWTIWLIGIFIPSFVYSIRGMNKTKKIAPVFVIYVIYFSARAISIYREIIVLFFNLLIQKKRTKKDSFS